MAVVSWEGGASPVAQVTRCTVGGTVAIGDTFTLTCGNKAITITATSTSATTTATQMYTALNALDATLYPEITGSFTLVDNVNATFDLTAITAGVPFIVVLTKVSALGTFTQSDTTAASGPNFWSVALNWDTGAVPAAPDDVIIEKGVDILYGLAQSAVTLTSLTIKQSFTGMIGLPQTNAGGYPEYRATYLAISATTINIGAGAGNGSQRIKLDVGSVQSTVNVFNSGSPLEEGIRSILFKGTHVSNAINIDKGSLGCGMFSGDTVKLTTLKQGFLTDIVSDTDVYVGPDCTQLTTITKTGGRLECHFTFTTLNNYGGDCYLEAGTPTTILCTAGTIFHKTAGTCTTATAGSTGSFDYRQNVRAITVTTFNLRKGGTLLDPAKRVTFTNPIVLTCSLADCTLDLGDTFNLQRS